MFMFLKTFINGFILLLFHNASGKFFYADLNCEYRCFWQMFSTMFITALNKVRSILDLQAFE